MSLFRFSSVAVLGALLTGTSYAQDLDLPEIGPDELKFSVENMDLSADPRQDFYRFAAGGWLDRVTRPEQLPSYNFVTIQKARIKTQLAAVLARAVEEAPTAPKGSPTQLVGDFYKAYMDVDRRNAEGLAPLQGEIDRIAEISSLEELARYAAHFQTVTGKGFLFGLGPQEDLIDTTRYAVYAGGGDFGLKDARDIYSSSDDAPRRTAYRTYIRDLMKTAGYEDQEAQRVADLVLDIETGLDAAKFTDADKRDFNKLYNPMTPADLQAKIPALDLSVYMQEAGLKMPKQIVLVEPNYYPVLAEMLRDRPLQDFKDYATFLLINHFSDVLSTDFDEPNRALNQVFQGVASLKPREERALGLLARTLGQPLSQLYVQSTYDEATGNSIKEMTGEILAAFRERIPTRDWLSDETRAEALAKLDAFYVAVGHPDEWIDFSSVTIVPDDAVANFMATTEFEKQRIFAKFGGPVSRDSFNGSSTLPIAMNSGYSFFINGFEITAAIAQPPTYQADGDPAVRFCGFGAVLGHETTHGFDTTGSQFDAKGNLRNWWTEEDRAAFIVEAKKLVDQTNGTDIVAGYHGNGALWLPENMADVGGITLAHAALMTYLAEHPDEDVKIDGFSQEQRCFIAWAQFWAEKATDEYLINVATSQNHPPNTYRTTAPLQHVDAFYTAFGIREGDPMWLPPEKRVHAW